MRQITYHIHRYQQGRAFVQTFKFDYEADRTILWGLQKIKDTQDLSLIHIYPSNNGETNTLTT